MAESKMPERIWADEECATKWLVTPTKGDTAYIRADLVEPLVEALRRSREAVSAVVLSTHSISFDADLRAIDAALQAYEAAILRARQTEATNDES